MFSCANCAKFTLKNKEAQTKDSRAIMQGLGSPFVASTPCLACVSSASADYHSRPNCFDRRQGKKLPSGAEKLFSIH